jgi:hypothetical protein
VEVEGELALALKTFLLGRDLRVALHLQTLGKELLLPVAAADLLERSLGLVDKTSTEGAKTDLYKRAVEQDLSVDVKVIDRLLQVRHEHHVASLVVLVVQSQEVDLAQHCPRTDDALTVLEEVCAECLDDGGCVVGEFAGSGCGFEVSRNRLPCLGLEDLNNRRGLEVDVLQPTHNDAVGRVLRDLEALLLVQALNVNHRAHKLSVQGALVCEALDILGRVGVDLLKRAGELVIEPLNERDNAAGNLENLALLDNGRLLIVLPLLSTLDNNDFLALLEDLKELAKLLVGAGKGQ